MESLFGTLGPIHVFASKRKAEIIEKVLINENNKKNVKNFIVLDGVYNNYLTFDQLLKEGENQRLDSIPYFKVEPKKDIFILLQSSGTSGVSKSVIISNKAFIATLMPFVYSKLLSDPVFAHVVPYGCISGATILFGFISRGITVVIYREYNEELILESIEKYKINFMYFCPAFGHKLLSDDLVNRYDLSSLKYLFTGGSAFAGYVGKAIVKKYKVCLEEGYGMTEFFTISDFPEALQTNYEYIPRNVGNVSQNTEIKIIDIYTGESLGPDIEGEICVRGDKMFSGYLNNELATKEVIDSEGWLRTGDIGHYDQKHRFFITDRLKELIKYTTIQVSPTEVEQFLLTHKCVAGVAVVGVKHQTQSQWPRAYVQTKANVTVTEKELKKFVSDNLNDAKQLRAGVVFVDHIPRTSIGKVDRRYFKQLVANEVIKCWHPL